MLNREPGRAESLWQIQCVETVSFLHACGPAGHLRGSTGPCCTRVLAWPSWGLGMAPLKGFQPSGLNHQQVRHLCRWPCLTGGLELCHQTRDSGRCPGEGQVWTGHSLLAFAVRAHPRHSVCKRHTGQVCSMSTAPCGTGPESVSRVLLQDFIQTWVGIRPWSCRARVRGSTSRGELVRQVQFGRG